MTKKAIAFRTFALLFIGGFLYGGLRYMDVNTNDTYVIMALAIVIVLATAILWPADKDTKKTDIPGRRSSDVAAAVALLINSEIRDVTHFPDGSIAVIYANNITYNYLPKMSVTFPIEITKSHEAFVISVLSVAIVDLDKRLKELERNTRITTDIEKFGKSFPNLNKE